MRTRCLIVFFVSILGFLGAQPLMSQEIEGKLAFTKVQKAGKIYFYALNKDPWTPIHLKADFTLVGQFKFSAPLPVKVVIPPRQKVSLGWLTLPSGPGHSSYQSSYDFNYGDANAVPDPRAVYLFPYEHGVKHGVIQGYFGQFTHQTCDCLDFDLAENSPICAAREGLVVFVKQDSNIGGAGPEFKKDGNFVRILHADGTWAQYYHLRKNGAKVKPGQRVSAGQVIGYSGHTGQAKGPHLHFDVNRATWDGPPTTIPTKFLVQGGQVVDPVEGKYYYSYHPGGPAFKEIKAEDYTEASLDNYSVPTALNGAVTLRTYQLDAKTLVYGLNGTSQDKTLTLDFPQLSNLSCSKSLPYTKVIPAGKEVYLLSLQRISPVGGYSFRTRYTYK